MTTKAWIQTRQKVLERDDYQCQRCGVSPEEENALHIHHIEPRSLGGSDDLENLETLCEECHKETHSGRQSEDDRKQIRCPHSSCSKRFSSVRGVKSHYGNAHDDYWRSYKFDVERCSECGRYFVKRANQKKSVCELHVIRRRINKRIGHDHELTEDYDEPAYNCDECGTSLGGLYARDPETGDALCFDCAPVDREDALSDN